MFYRAVIQSIFLYDSKSCAIFSALLAWLKGFHILVVWGIAQVNKPWREANGM